MPPVPKTLSLPVPTVEMFNPILASVPMGLRIGLVPVIALVIDKVFTAGVAILPGLDQPNNKFPIASLIPDAGKVN